MSLQEISDLLDRLVRERAADASAGRSFIPEPVALLAIARRAIDAAAAGCVLSSCPPARRELYTKLGALSGEVLIARDRLDELLAMPQRRADVAAAEFTEASRRARAEEIERQEAARERRKNDLADHNATPKPRKTSPIYAFPVGTVVDVLGSNTQRVEYVGKVIKLTTRLHVEALGDGPTTGHMAYEATFVRARVRKHEHRFGVMEPSATPSTDVECCNGCERSARELGIAVRS